MLTKEKNFLLELSIIGTLSHRPKIRCAVSVLVLLLVEGT